MRVTTISPCDRGLYSLQCVFVVCFTVYAKSLKLGRRHMRRSVVTLFRSYHQIRDIFLSTKVTLLIHRRMGRSGRPWSG